MFCFFFFKNRYDVVYGYLNHACLNQKGLKKFLFGKSFNS